MFSRACLLIPVLLLVGVLPASEAYAIWGSTKITTISVFAAVDSKSNEGGVGAALTIHEREVTDLSYTDFGDFSVAQFAKLSPKQVGPYSGYFGFALGYASKEEGLDGPDGMMTGLAFSLSRMELAGGLSLDLRASSLNEDFDPVDWFTNPDVLSFGAGLSYKF